MIESKILKYIFLIFIVLINFISPVTAQETPVQLKQIGISIAFQTEIRSMSGKEKLREIFNTGHSWIENENVIHRIISDRESGLHLGYDLVIESNGELGKYKVTFKPLTRERGKEIRLFDTSKLGKGTRIIDTNTPEARAIEITIQPLSKYPAPVFVEDGNVIEINVLENSKSQEKLVDIIKIVSGSNSIRTNTSRNPVDNRADADKKSARDFNPESIELKLNDCKFIVNNKLFADLRGTISGTIPYVYFQDKGIYAFSLFPRKGYDFKKIGTVENNKISFEIDGNNYELISGSPFTEMSGNWNLWVFHDPEYKPKVAMTGSYLVGTLDSMESFFKKT